LFVSPFSEPVCALARTMVCGLALGLAASQAHAEVVYNGINERSTALDGVYSGYRSLLTPATSTALRIYTGDSAYQVNSLDVITGRIELPWPSAQAEHPQVSIYATLAGDDFYRRPDAAQLLGTLSFSGVLASDRSPQVSRELLRLTPTGSFTLAAHTDYWFVMTASQRTDVLSGNAHFPASGVWATNSKPGADLKGSGYGSSDAGVGTNFNVGSGFPVAFRIDATAVGGSAVSGPASPVPEPQTAWLMLAGLGALRLFGTVRASGARPLRLRRPTAPATRCGTARRTGR